MRCLAACALILTALAPSSAFAGHWALVGAEGAANDRRHFYAEFDRVSPRYDSEAEGGDQAMMDAAMRSRNMGAYLDARRILRVRVIQVLEKPEAPDTIEYQVTIRCSARQFRIDAATAWHRNA